MTLSLLPHNNLGHELRTRAVLICKESKYPFAVGRIINIDKFKETLDDIVVDFLNISLIGKTTRSHDWETLAIYNTGCEYSFLKPSLDYFKETGSLKIAGEVF
jgi:hypothetical protein